MDIADLNVEVTTDPEKAQFVLAHGTEALGLPDGSVELRSFDELKATLRQCGELGKRPMVIANPDFVTVSGCGALEVSSKRMMPCSRKASYACHVIAGLFDGLLRGLCGTSMVGSPGQPVCC